jgi:hypothetical protein
MLCTLAAVCRLVVLESFQEVRHLGLDPLLPASAARPLVGIDDRQDHQEYAAYFSPSSTTFEHNAFNSW